MSEISPRAHSSEPDAHAAMGRQPRIRQTSRAWCPAAGCLLASLAAVPCRAEFDPERYLIFELGRVSLRPQLEVAQTYDSNIFYNEENPAEDFFTTVRPGLSMIFGDREFNFVSIRYSLDASFYSDRDDLNNIGHFVTHQSRFRFSRLSLQATDTLSATDALLGGTFSYIQRRVGQIALDDLWRADYYLSPRTLVGIKGLIDYVDYDADDLKPYHLYDYLSYAGGIRVGYLPSDKITIFPEITIGQTILSENDPAALQVPDGPDPDTEPDVREPPVLNSYGFSIGAEGDFTPKLTGIVSAGYEIRSYEDDTDIPNGLVANVELRWQARAKTSVALSYRHWTRVSRETLGYTASAHRITFSASQELGTQDRWFVNLDGYYQFDDYDRPVQTGGQSVVREDTLVGIAVRASFRWYSWLVASASYDFRAFEDNIPSIQNYEVHRVSLRLAAGY